LQNEPDTEFDFKSP